MRSQKMQIDFLHKVSVPLRFLKGLHILKKHKYFPQELYMQTDSAIYQCFECISQSH